MNNSKWLISCSYCCCYALAWLDRRTAVAAFPGGILAISLTSYRQFLPCTTSAACSNNGTGNKNNKKQHRSDLCFPCTTYVSELDAWDDIFFSPFCTLLLFAFLRVFLQSIQVLFQCRIDPSSQLSLCDSRTVEKRQASSQSNWKKVYSLYAGTLLR